MTHPEIPSHPFALPQGELLSITGPDALAFAQAQLMNDVEALALGGWQWNGWLDAKGRLQALFGLLREDDQRLLAWLPAGGAEALATALARFRFRSKLQLLPDRERTLAGVAGAATGTAGEFPLPDDPLIGPRHLRLLASGAAPLAGARVVDAWHAADLRLGLPWLRPDGPGTGRFVPQWLGLDTLPALSLRKGCYPGQEIVARMHYLGQSKRGPALLRGAGSVPASGWRALAADDQALGELVDAVDDGEGGWLALAALSGADQAAVARVADGQSMQPATVLRGGLRSSAPPAI
ncbi:MAG: folate-binding protein YgfZ [Xanthomonadales bacterium]|nr:folate-binding protein YgfZ [Xanthomonadales bacterium]